MRGLRPLVAEQLARHDGLDGRLGLAGTVRAEHVEMQPRVQVGGPDDGPVTRRHAGDDVGGEGLLAGAGAPAELAGERLRRLGARVVADARAVAGGGEAPRRPPAVQAAARDAHRAAGRERVGRDRGDRARAQRRHRPCVEQRERLAGARVGQADEPDHGRQRVLARVAGEARDPLEHRQVAPERGHRPEVAVRRAVEIDLRRHAPLPAVVTHEGVAHALDRALRRHGGADRVVVQDGQGRHGRRR